MANIFDTTASLQWGAASAFRGAELNRLSADRWASANHPDTEVQLAARTLRARARDLVRNNPYAAGLVEAAADNIVGWEGIRLKPLVMLPSGEPNRPVNWALEIGWKDWGADHATVDGVDTWYELERLLVKSWWTDGEVFLRRRRGWDNPFGYAVEMIDPDLLDEDLNEKRERAGREIVMGVELDDVGRPAAYHFWREHPDNLAARRERVRVPANEIRHLFSRYRVGQHRGYSLFAPILTTVEMVDGLTEAELVASRYHASKMGFITQNSPEAIDAYAARLRMQSEDGKESAPRRMKIAPGVVEELIPGQGFEGFDPTHPNTAFDPFLKTMLRGVARGFGMSYLTLTGDVGEANYSSMRAGLLPERDHWRVLQNVVSSRVHRWIYRDFVDMGLLTRALRLPSSVSEDYYAAEWRGRRWQWVDPSNDLEAFEREVALGLNSRQRGASDRGNDFETIIDETADDLDYAEKAKVDVTGLGKKAPAPTPGPPPQEPGKGNGNRKGPKAGRLTSSQFALFGG